MTDERIGQLIAAVRIHCGLRQIDVARIAGVDQKVVSLIERGHLEQVSVKRFRRVCAALGIEPSLTVRWKGGLGDRLIDRGHADLVERTVAALQAIGWEVVPEFSFNVYGERGSVDILAWDPVRRALLIVEVKTRLLDLQALLMAMSKKVRVVPGIVADDRDWKRRAMSHVIVLADTRANRSTVAAHRATFDATFPARTAEVRRWLRQPVGDLAGLMLLAPRRASPVVGEAQRRVRLGHARPADG